MVLAPTLPLAILAAEKAGLGTSEIVWIGETRQLKGIDGGKYIEIVSDRPFNDLATTKAKQLYADVLKEARMRWMKAHGSTWTQVYFR